MSRHDSRCVFSELANKQTNKHADKNDEVGSSGGIDQTIFLTIHKKWSLHIYSRGVYSINWGSDTPEKKQDFLQLQQQHRYLNSESEK